MQNPLVVNEIRVRRIAPAIARGVVAAMAMTGLRAATTGVGLLDETPPEAIIERKGRALLELVPPRRRRATVEFLHWAYGGAGGAVYAALPAPLRRRSLTGPAYGLATWLLFEAILAPGLRLDEERPRRVRDHLAVAADHVLYGVIVAGGLRRSR